MFITGAGGLWECKNTEVVWELRKMGFVKAVVSRAVFLQGCPLGELLLYNNSGGDDDVDDDDDIS